MPDDVHARLLRREAAAACAEHGVTGCRPCTEREEVLDRLRVAATNEVWFSDTEREAVLTVHEVQRGLARAVVAAEGCVNTAMAKYDYPEPDELRAAILDAFIQGVRNA